MGETLYRPPFARAAGTGVNGEEGRFRTAEAVVQKAAGPGDVRGRGAKVNGTNRAGCAEGFERPGKMSRYVDTRGRNRVEEEHLIDTGCGQVTTNDSPWVVQVTDGGVEPGEIRSENGRQRGVLREERGEEDGVVTANGGDESGSQSDRAVDRVGDEVYFEGGGCPVKEIEGGECEQEVSHCARAENEYLGTHTILSLGKRIGVRSKSPSVILS